VPVHRQNRLVQGQVWPSRNQTQQKICMLLQRRDAPAPRLSRTAARLPKALDPDNRRAGTDIKLLGRRAPRRPTFNFRHHSPPHVLRIGLRHRPASQNRINADRLSHPSPSENLLDSIGTEHALVTRIGSQFPDPGSHHWNGSHIDGTRRVRFSSTALPPARVMVFCTGPDFKKKEKSRRKTAKIFSVCLLLEMCVGTHGPKIIYRYQCSMTSPPP